MIQRRPSFLPGIPMVVMISVMIHQTTAAATTSSYSRFWQRQTSPLSQRPRNLRSTKTIFNMMRHATSPSCTNSKLANIQAHAAHEPKQSPVMMQTELTTTPSFPSNSISSASNRRRQYFTTQAKQDNPLFGNIAGFYDSLSGIWEREYGEHMHHGWYGETGSENLDMSVQEAQIALMRQTANLGGIKELSERVRAEEGRPLRILDVGCGIGGASRWLAKTFGADVTGITLSPKQVERANELAKFQGISEKTTFKVANALESGLPDDYFDVVWSLEMAEHIPDRPKFLSEMNRVLNKNHGRMAMVTWCKKNGMLDFDEEIALNYISEWYNLPRWVSIEKWASLAGDAGFEGNPTPQDWSKGIRPMQFWGDILVTSLNPRNIIGLLQIGDSGVKAGAAAGLMGYGFYKDFIVFGALRMDVKKD